MRSNVDQFQQSFKGFIRELLCLKYSPVVTLLDSTSCLCPSCLIQCGASQASWRARGNPLRQKYHLKPARVRGSEFTLFRSSSVHERSPKWVRPQETALIVRRQAVDLNAPECFSCSSSLQHGVCWDDVIARLCKRVLKRPFPLLMFAGVCV